MDRVLPSEGRGCWFDPSRAHQSHQVVSENIFCGVTLQMSQTTSVGSTSSHGKSRVRLFSLFVQNSDEPPSVRSQAARFSLPFERALSVVRSEPPGVSQF